MKKTNYFRFGFLSLMILVVAVSRMLPHPPNLTPVGAMAIFGAAYLSRKHWALLVPLLALWVSDMLINNILYAEYFENFVFFYQGFYWTYLAFALIILMGFLLLRKIKIANVLLASLLASVIFFLVSNFGVWMSGTMYPKTSEGLVACYTAGIPFFRNMLVGDLFYTGLLFGLFEFAQYKIPKLQAIEVFNKSQNKH